jgi:hypothetical protein
MIPLILHSWELIVTVSTLLCLPDWFNQVIRWFVCFTLVAYNHSHKSDFGGSQPFPHKSNTMSDSVSSDVSAPYMAGCTHPFQCPNPLCQHDFSTRRGLSMHFYHQENLFWNPPEWFRTNAEIEFPAVLPKKMPVLPPTSVDSSDQNKADDAPCWSVDDE